MMPREAEGLTDFKFPGTWDAHLSQIVCDGFCNKLCMRQGLERIRRFALYIVILLGARLLFPLHKINSLCKGLWGPADSGRHAPAYPIPRRRIWKTHCHGDQRMVKPRLVPSCCQARRGFCGWVNESTIRSLRTMPPGPSSLQLGSRYFPTAASLAGGPSCPLLCPVLRAC